MRSLVTGGNRHIGPHLASGLARRHRCRFDFSADGEVLTGSGQGRGLSPTAVAV